MAAYMMDGFLSKPENQRKKLLLFHVIKLTKTESIVFIVVSAEWASLKSHSLKDFFIWNKILLSRIMYSAAATGEGVKAC